eukprot:PhM_4_TR18591/c0_g1_i1/m.97036
MSHLKLPWENTLGSSTSSLSPRHFHDHDHDHQMQLSGHQPPRSGAPACTIVDESPYANYIDTSFTLTTGRTTQRARKLRLLSDANPDDDVAWETSVQQRGQALRAHRGLFGEARVATPTTPPPPPPACDPVVESSSNAVVSTTTKQPGNNIRLLEAVVNEFTGGTTSSKKPLESPTSPPVMSSKGNNSVSSPVQVAGKRVSISSKPKPVASAIRTPAIARAEAALKRDTKLVEHLDQIVQQYRKERAEQLEAASRSPPRMPSEKRLVPHQPVTKRQRSPEPPEFFTTSIFAVSTANNVEGQTHSAAVSATPSGGGDMNDDSTSSTLTMSVLTPAGAHVLQLMERVEQHQRQSLASSTAASSALNSPMGLDGILAATVAPDPFDWDANPPMLPVLSNNKQEEEEIPAKSPQPPQTTPRSARSMRLQAHNTKSPLESLQEQANRTPQNREERIQNPFELTPSRPRDEPRQNKGKLRKGTVLVSSRPRPADEFSVPSLHTVAFQAAQPPAAASLSETFPRRQSTQSIKEEIKLPLLAATHRTQNNSPPLAPVVRGHISPDPIPPSAAQQQMLKKSRSKSVDVRFHLPPAARHHRESEPVAGGLHQKSTAGGGGSLDVPAVPSSNRRSSVRSSMMREYTKPTTTSSKGSTRSAPSKLQWANVQECLLTSGLSQSEASIGGTNELLLLASPAFGQGLHEDYEALLQQRTGVKPPNRLDSTSSSFSMSSEALQAQRSNAIKSPSTRFALLICCDAFDSYEIEPISQALDDAQRMRVLLEALGYDVCLLCSTETNPALRPTQKNILKRLYELEKTLSAVDSATASSEKRVLPRAFVWAATRGLTGHIPLACPGEERFVTCCDTDPNEPLTFLPVALLMTVLSRVETSCTYVAVDAYAAHGMRHWATSRGMLGYSYVTGGARGCGSELNTMHKFFTVPEKDTTGRQKFYNNGAGQQVWPFHLNQGVLTWYLLKSLEGKGCKDSRMTANSTNTYIALKLMQRAIKVQTNAHPYNIGDTELTSSKAALAARRHLAKTTFRSKKQRFYMHLECPLQFTMNLPSFSTQFLMHMKRLLQHTAKKDLPLEIQAVFPYQHLTISLAIDEPVTAVYSDMVEYFAGHLGPSFSIECRTLTNSVHLGCPAEHFNVLRDAVHSALVEKRWGSATAMQRVHVTVSGSQRDYRRVAAYARLSRFNLFCSVSFVSCGVNPMDAAVDAARRIQRTWFRYYAKNRTIMLLRAQRVHMQERDILIEMFLSWRAERTAEYTSTQRKMVEEDEELQREALLDDVSYRWGYIVKEFTRSYAKLAAEGKAAFVRRQKKSVIDRLNEHYGGGVTARRASSLEGSIVIEEDEDPEYTRTVVGGRSDVEREESVLRLCLQEALLRGVIEMRVRQLLTLLRESQQQQRWEMAGRYSIAFDEYRARLDLLNILREKVVILNLVVDRPQPLFYDES